MIWHFLEVWGLLLAAFAAGCLLGTLLYVALAASPLAEAQVSAAETIAGSLGGIRRQVRAGRDAGGYPQPLQPATYGGSAPYAASATDAYAASALVPVTGDDTPVAGAVAPIEESHEFVDGEWEDDADWERGHDDLPLPESATPFPVSLPERSPAPAASAAVPDEPEARAGLPAMRPLTLPGPRNGVPDNLQRIRGIGQKNEELLNSLGIYHFGQIAAWTPAEGRWVASHLSFPERIERDDWVGQAIILATGGDTGYVKAADRRKGGEEPSVAA